MADTLLWLTHEAFGQHDMGAGHPESPARLVAVEQAVAGSARLAALRRVVTAPPASVEQLARAHDRGHVETLLRAAPAFGQVRLDADTVMNPYSATAALRAAGAGVAAVDALLAGRASQVFAAVRPPGHHAERAQAMGFCLFDNVAVAAHQALAAGLARVAILDFDVHYGNGTVDIFRADPRVMVCNTYQYPLYPYWPDGGGAAHIVDAPLAPLAGGSQFRAAVEAIWEPALDRFGPELVLVSAGFDAHRDDPLANLRLTEDDYRWIGLWIRDLADRHCSGRVAALLEGGYALGALGRSVAAFLQGLHGLDAH